MTSTTRLPTVAQPSREVSRTSMTGMPSTVAMVELAAKTPNRSGTKR